MGVAPSTAVGDARGSMDGAKEENSSKDGNIGAVQRREVADNEQVGGPAEEKTFAEVRKPPADKETHGHLPPGEEHTAGVSVEEQQKHHRTGEEGDRQRTDPERPAGVIEDTNHQAGNQPHALRGEQGARRDFQQNVNEDHRTRDRCGRRA